MRMTVALGRLAFCGLLAGALPGCGRDSDEPVYREVTGRVTSIDMSTGKVAMSTFNAKHNRTDLLEGRLANDAEILIDGATATLADVEAGDRVTVTGRIEKHGGQPQLVATRIEIRRQEFAPGETDTQPVADAGVPTGGEEGGQDARSSVGQ